ncbi:hypothetical protein [Sphingomonas sp.]|uniref:hypothetical protein n=1 Tax=Sphingomonas sp. TaxID=28214 RepID=UPI003CC5E38C
MKRLSRPLLALGLSTLALATSVGAQLARSGDGPADQGPRLPQRMGSAATGRDVFRNETFGNEGFWTDAVRLPAGIMAARVTPMQALELGLQVDVDAVDAQTKTRLAAELAADPTGRSSAILNDPAMTGKLIMANAVMGMTPKAGKVGATCALCHSMSDGSIFTSPAGGSIGHRVDGLANHSLHLGEIFATAANTRALYTVAQLQLTANHGKTLGRAAHGLDENSTEDEVDAYFRDHRNYPVGMFDDSFDGNGNPMHNTPLFRQDLAVPYGSEGTFTRLEDFSNLVYTTLFDQTALTTPGGRQFIHMLAGAAGDEMIDDYVKVLRDTGVTGYPYVRARGGGRPGALATPIGLRVNDARLLAMNAYLSRLQAPAGQVGDPQAVARGRAVFATSGCTTCHNADQRRAVPTTIHPMAQIFPGDRPVTLALRMPPLNPVLDTPSSFFDDKMAVVNASLRGEKRGIAMPLLLDLARKPTFLHDDSVRSFADLFDARRGGGAPHPFFVGDSRQRADLIAFLKASDTRAH